ncbi:hypothetical protein BDA99DRAFT_510258 [Phascolomyces articulosus]|uniref:SH3 domain-containing protein n=1 Tax=Phascolomyces articulosus TaxID=60185 RepID=A0AAD5K0N1_9FUNG|nr:hypothetical protein BDA99DRAFT_510258 [Phascolomyces articulosus]
MTVTLFANNFWGKDDAGYNVLMHKMNMAKKTCEDLKSLYSAKASLHEEFGKKLAKQTKIELGREEIGTINTLLLSAQKEMEATAQANIELAQKIRSELELSMENFISDQKNRRKVVQTNVDKAHRNKQLHTAQVNKTKEKYEAECVKSVSLENQLSTTTGFREIERLRQKFERSQNEIKTLEKEYKNACSKLTDATTVWNNEWKIACVRFQEMEEARVEFLHHSLCIYVNILSSGSSQDQESYERFWKALDQFNAKADIEQFIDEMGTGPMIPEPPIFVDYSDDPEKTLPRFKKAQFTENDILVPAYIPPPSATSNLGLSGGPIASMIKSTAKRSTSFCEPKRRTSTRLTKQLPPVQQQQQQKSDQEQQKQQREEQIVARLDNRRVNLYASVSEKPKKPAPAKNASTIASTSQQYHDLATVDHGNDEPIDPRAQVVVAIGNNMFSVDPNQSQPNISTTTTEKRSSVRRSSVNKTKSNSNTAVDNLYENSADLEEAFSDSIKGLLQELGVQQHPTNPVEATADKLRRRKSVNAHHNQQQHYHHQQQQHQQHQHPQHYSMDVGYQNGAFVPGTSMMVNNSNTTMVPTIVAPVTGTGNPMIWARALYDYYSDRPEDLSFNRGQWLAIVRNDDQLWWLAHKWDDTNGRLSETCGYVASNYVQIC